MAKTEFERRVKIKMKRLQRSRAFLIKNREEQQEYINKLQDDDSIKNAMQELIKDAGKISQKEAGLPEKPTGP